MIRVAIVGFGFMGRTHFQCYRNNDACEVATVVTRDEVRKQGKPIARGNLAVGADHLNVAGVHFADNWKDVIDDPSIDLVDICTPTHTHAEIGLAALAAGKHVFVEKPMARSLSDAQALVDASRKYKRILHVGNVLRYWGQYVEAKNMTERGDMGPFRYGRFERHGGKPAWDAAEWLSDAAKSGGAVLDLALHDIDAAIWMFGMPASIDVTGRLEGDLPVAMDATWNYRNGAQVHLHARWDLQIGAQFRYAFAIESARGSLQCDSTTGAVLTAIEGGQVREIPFDRRLAYQLQADDVLDAVTKGKNTTRVTPESSLQSLKFALEHLAAVETYARTLPQRMTRSPYDAK